MKALVVMIVAFALACSVVANNASFADELRENSWWYYIAPDKLYDYAHPRPQIGVGYMYWDSPHVAGPSLGGGDIILCDGPIVSCGS